MSSSSPSRRAGTVARAAFACVILGTIAVYVVPVDTRNAWLPFLARSGPAAQGEAPKDAAGSGRHGKGSGHGGDRTGGPGGPPAVVTVSAKAGSLPVMRHTIGTIVPVASTGLASPAAGIVAAVLGTDGATVRAGDLIVKLDDRSINAGIARENANLMRDQAALENANANLKRTRTLNNSGAGTRQQYDEALAASKQAEAAIAVDNANLTTERVALTQTEVRAPFDGKLGVVQVSPGAFVSAGANIVTLTRMKPVFAEFILPETDLALARDALADGKLDVAIAPVLSSGSTAPTSGPVVFIDNTVDTASGTFRLRARLDNADGNLWPGQSLDVEVRAGEKRGLVLVPTVAVQVLPDGFTCYVVGPDSSVSVRKVTVALNAGAMTGISDGLKAGETVVTEGQSGLADGAKVIVSGAKAAPLDKTADGSGAAL